MAKKTLKKTAIIILLAINIFVVSLTFLSAFGGIVNPGRFYAVPALAAMTFPVWAVIVPVMLIVDLFTKRTFAIIPAATMLICVQAFWNYCPINLFSEKNCDNDSTFTLMTYNSLGFAPYNPEKFSDTEQSLSVSAIIDNNPDFVCLQESGIPKRNSRLKITQQQVEKIDSLYPYRKSVDTHLLSLLSKYKIKSLEITGFNDPTASMAHYVVEIGNIPLSIYNVHLQSIGLSDNDKELYMEITEGHARHNIKKAKRQLWSKLSHAFRQRAEQAKTIREIIESDSIYNTIVCGDFNDIPGCYAMRTICGDDIFNANTRCGFGPSITYRANRFYFHIDQILYRGNIIPVKIKVIKEGESDHFPVMATFKILSSAS